MEEALNEFKKGSMKELLAISLPLMLSNLSTSLMSLSDRVFVARLGWEHLQGVSNASSVSYTISFSLAGIAAMAAVFVGRFNGEGRLHKISMPVWQMIYFSLFTSLITLPIGLWGTEYILPEKVIATGQGYFRWAAGSSFLVPLLYALGSFFSGTGDTKTISVSTLVANFLNIVLNTAFIFGFPGCFKEFGLNWFDGPDIIAPMYGEGAAIATIISEVVQILILLYFMLRAENKKKYKTNNYAFNYPLFMSCVRKGLPNTFTRFFELLGWSILSICFTTYSINHMNILAVSINLFIAISFVGSSIRDSIAVIISNQIGAKDYSLINKSVLNAVKLQTLSLLVVFIPMLIFSDISISLLVGGNHEVAANALLYEGLKYSLPVMMLLIFFGNLANLFMGVFMAGGDIKLVTIISTVVVWLFAIIPSILAIMYLEVPLKASMLMFLPSRLILIAILYIYYKKNKWIKDI